MSEYIVKDGVLYHHGIPGQKWGIRRYQNPDGSLTPAGRERYTFSAKDEQRYRRLKSKRIKNYYQATEQNRLYNKKKRLSNLSKEDMEKEIKEHDAKAVEKQAKLKTAAKIGLAVAGTALVAYGAYKLSEANKDKKFRAAKSYGAKFYEKLASDRYFDADLATYSGSEYLERASRFKRMGNIDEYNWSTQRANEYYRQASEARKVAGGALKKYSQYNPRRS